MADWTIVSDAVMRDPNRTIDCFSDDLDDTAVSKYTLHLSL